MSRPFSRAVCSKGRKQSIPLATKVHSRLLVTTYLNNPFLRVSDHRIISSSKFKINPPINKIIGSRLNTIVLYVKKNYNIHNI